MAHEDTSKPDKRAGHSLTPAERSFSCQAVAGRCQDVAEQLVHLAELLRCTRPDPSAPHCQLGECAMVKCIILGRRLRTQFFAAQLFGDPAWDILLELYLARLEERRTEVSAICAEASVSEKAALRYIRALVERQMVIRTSNVFDQRVVYIELTDSALENMRRYFDRFSELLVAASSR